MALRSLQSSSIITVFLVSIFIITISSSMAEADSSKSVPATVEATVHIVYTERPQDEELEFYHLRTLSSVLGSEEAAKGALLYTYKHAACGFSAKLTPSQVEEISKRPGVLQVVESRTIKLHDSPAML
ncbi:subtilisin-like protease SBT3.17 [Cynara cardunculus var. scolymus]|uniref:subtilisin-like protease SBT3.17 n=1 Tax=Cynara cardunculus var. scolymus TaxID=59895 RepID=UPI000D627927|nr:subtilisin-like protease SBT3.17 [Cynara cardunculus var. scolymus]